VETAEATRAEVDHFCAACHLYPTPDSFPRHRWKEEVEQGYHFYESSTLRLKVPPLPAVVRYYENRAPEEFPLLPATPTAAQNPFRFERIAFPNPEGTQLPAVANVRFAQLAKNGPPELIVCEMHRGQIFAVNPRDPGAKPRLLSTAVAHPAHAEAVDLDRDGRQDLLVSDLGKFFPTDERVGKLFWLQARADGGFEPQVLLSDVGRVADAQAADFDGDGDLDIVVAVFGWTQTGEVVYLENQTTDWKQPKFTPRILDKRHGAIHVPIADLNGDGKLDFVALLSQENEIVIAFLNDGKRNFTPQTIYQAPHPGFGSSGIQLVDLDRDGKLDVLYCNGDTLDRTMLRPYHGIHWLRNTGGFPFEAQRLTSMYGVHRALAADFDGDGDMDVAGVALLPEPGYTALCRQHDLDAVILLEQTEPGKFLRHSLERVNCDHATADVADIDGDGRPDFVTGTFSLIAARRERGEAALSPRNHDWITVWRNAAGRPQR
jgi:hypothetical protein